MLCELVNRDTSAVWTLQTARVATGGLIALLLATLPATSTGLVAFDVRGDAVEMPLGGVVGDAARGLGIVRDRRKGNCLICHAMPRAIPLADEPFQGVIGPPLDGVARRLTVGQIRLRMIDQSRINPATIMPPFYRVENLRDVAPEYGDKPALDAQEIEDVVAYLATLKEKVCPPAETF